MMEDPIPSSRKLKLRLSSGGRTLGGVERVTRYSARLLLLLCVFLVLLLSLSV